MKCRENTTLIFQGWCDHMAAGDSRRKESGGLEAVLNKVKNLIKLFRNSTFALTVWESYALTITKRHALGKTLNWKGPATL